MAGGRRRVAVVGGGAAGLGAAWTLAPEYEVTIYEAGDALGGHAYAHPFGDTGVHVDMGVMITLPWAYPNLYCMFQRYGVSTSAAGATLAVSFPAKDGAVDTWGTDASFRQTDLFRRFEHEASRFELLMFEIGALPLEMQQKPILYYLRGVVPGLPHSGDFSDEFLAKGLLPLLSLFLVTRDSLLETPAWSLSMMFRYGTISFFSPTTWRTIDGGTREYISRLTRSFEFRRFLRTKVVSIQRNNGSVTVRDDAGSSERYDEVVIATAADTALAMLEGATDDETRILSAFRYEDAIAYLHQDGRVLATAAPGVFFHYRSESPSPELKLEGAMTYDMKRAAGLVGKVEGHVLVTIVTDPPATPFEGLVTTQEFRHMIPDQAALEARLELHKVQGKNRVWFCGDYTTFASHEDAFVSGMIVGEALGGKYLFREHAAAFERYRQNRLLMFRSPLVARFGLAARAELIADLARTGMGMFWVWWNGKFPD